MWQLILGTAGFVLYFVYDINSVLSKNVCLQKFFAWGSILVVASVVAEFCSAWGQGHRSVEAVIGFGIGALFFLGLLIYTLFFALPFEPRSSFMGNLTYTVVQGSSLYSISASATAVTQ